MYCKPLFEAIQKDFVILSIKEPYSFFYSIVGHQNRHWFLKTETIFVDNGKSVLQELSQNYDSAIMICSGRRTWIKKLSYFNSLQCDTPLDPQSLVPDLDPQAQHQCFVQVLNNCFEFLTRYDKAEQQYKAQKKVEIPVLEYFLNVPYDEKKEASRSGAQWSEWNGNDTQRFLYRWFIPMDLISDVRPFLRWAHPNDHQFLIDLCERRNKFEAVWGKARQDAKKNFESSKVAVIKAFLEQKKNKDE